MPKLNVLLKIKIMNRELNPMLHSQLRLSIISILMNVEEVDFNYLKETTKATSGNISVQIEKLSNCKYLTVTKEFVGKKSRTSYRITDEGRAAFEEYVDALKGYITVNK